MVNVLGKAYLQPLHMTLSKLSFNGGHLVDYVGKIIAEHKREQRYGMAQGLIVLGEKTVIQMMALTPLWWIVLIQEE